jgi:hypothetical protein
MKEPREKEIIVEEKGKKPAKPIPKERAEKPTGKPPKPTSPPPKGK